MAVEKSKPFDYVQEVTKQQMTLSTAVVTITVAFVKDIAKNAPDDARVVLYAAWALFALAIVAGVFTLLNLSGNVGTADQASSKGIYADGIKLFAGLQVVLFILALCGTIYFGVRSFDPTPSDCVATTKQTTTSGGATVERVTTAAC